VHTAAGQTERREKRGRKKTALNPIKKQQQNPVN